MPEQQRVHADPDEKSGADVGREYNAAGRNRVKK